MDWKIMIGIMILLILLNNFIYVRSAIYHGSDSIRLQLDMLNKSRNMHQKYIEEAHPDLIKKQAEADGWKFAE